MPGQFLTIADRERLSHFPIDISNDGLITCFTLSPSDLYQIPLKSASYNRIGFAMQLCTLRYIGFCPDQLTDISFSVVSYVAKQINVAPNEIIAYGNREQTRTDHFNEIQKYLGFRRASPEKLKLYDEWLIERALAHDKPTYLLQILCEKILKDKMDNGSQYQSKHKMLLLFLSILDMGWDDILRVVASIKLGWVTASLFISKLKEYLHKNTLSSALIECGRIEKSIFIPSYIDLETERRKLGIQLNKGEAIHSLRQFLFFANEGKIWKSQLEDQTNQALCLTLLTNAVICWNTRYIQAILDQLKSENHKMQESDLIHISPCRFEHINRYGRYNFNIEEELNRTALHPLNF